jgi:hypothetical protein
MKLSTAVRIFASVLACAVLYSWWARPEIGDLIHVVGALGAVNLAVGGHILLALGK